MDTSANKPIKPQFQNKFHVSGVFNQYLNADKTSVLQETRMFNETPVNARKCTRILTKILYLLNQVKLN